MSILARKSWNLFYSSLFCTFVNIWKGEKFKFWLFFSSDWNSDSNFERHNPSDSNLIPIKWVLMGFDPFTIEFVWFQVKYDWFRSIFDWFHFIFDGFQFIFDWINRILNKSIEAGSDLIEFVMTSKIPSRNLDWKFN